jgi:hypothetical protein
MKQGYNCQVILGVLEKLSAEKGRHPFGWPENGTSAIRSCREARVGRNLVCLRQRACAGRQPQVSLK